MIKKGHTTYYDTNNKGIISLTVNEECEDNVSLHEYGEPCSGVLKHWGSRDELIEELEYLIKLLKESKSL